MTARHKSLRIAAALALAVLPGVITAADMSGPDVVTATRNIPPEVASALTAAAAAANPTAALAAIDAYAGPPHALIELARAQANDQLADASSATASSTDPHRLAATAAYRKALTLDPGLRAAHLGLAQQAARANDWTTALAELAPALDSERATAPELLLYAQAAIATGDWTLAAVISERGILRFPAEKAFRQQRLDALVRAGEILPARAAAYALLDSSPDDPALWRTIAWCDRQEGDTVGERAALEAVWISERNSPGNSADAMRLARAQLDANEGRAALATLSASGDGSSSTAPTPTPTTADQVALAVAAARACRDLDAAKAWLARIPPPDRDHRLRLLAAEIAVQSGDNAAAAQAAAELIALGENDPAILVWAGALAERGSDLPHAEAWYRQAFASVPIPAGNSGKTSVEAPGVATAGIRLAALLLKQDRRDEAREVLATILAKHPDDESAHRLQELANQAR